MEKKKKSIWSDKRSYGKRLSLSGVVLTALCYTYLFFGPLETVAFSAGSLNFGYRDVDVLLLVAMLAVLAALVPLTALLRGRVFNTVLCLFTGATVAGYVQALLLNSGLGLLTGDGIDWSKQWLNGVLSALLWIGLPTLFFVLMLVRRKIWRKVTIWVCVGMTLMQLVPTAAIYLGFYEKARVDNIGGYNLSDEGFYELTEGGVYVFVLDRLDYDYLEKVMKEDPDFFSDLEGFTSYTNAISGFARTQPALSHLLTGEEEITYRVSEQEYYSRIWKEHSLLADLQQEGYRNYLYTNIRNLFSEPQQAAALAENANSGHGKMYYGAVLKKLWNLSAFRYAPTVFKPAFWSDTNYYNEGIFAAARYAAYQFDDAGYAEGYSEAEAVAGSSFKLYHFFGPHAPYTMNADGTPSETETNVTAQTMGSFTNLQKLFARMKELGVYDSATIIITGDHGAAISDTKPLQKATRIGLFYKPAGAERAPLQYSAAPVSTANLPATIAKAAGLDAAAYGTPIDEIAEDADVTRYYYKTVCDPVSFRETQLCIYEVRGDASKMENWVLVETVDIPYSYN